MPRMELHSHCRKHDLKSVTARDKCIFLESYWAWMSMTCPLIVGSPVLRTVGLDADIGIPGWGGPPWRSLLGGEGVQECTCMGGPWRSWAGWGGHLGLAETAVPYSHLLTTPGYILPWHTLQPCRNSKERNKKKILWKSNSVVLAMAVLWKPGNTVIKGTWLCGSSLSSHTEENKMSNAVLETHFASLFSFYVTVSQV